MRAWGWSLLAAVLPWTGPAESPLLPLTHAAPCAVTVDVRVQTPLAWGRVEWRTFSREVEQIWSPYGLTICWQTAGTGCDGFGVQLRVFVTGALPPTSAAAAAPPVVGRIRFVDGEPGTEIFLSLEGGRYLVVRANLGGRTVGDWPAGIAERLLPAVLGRALAHEIGHFVLGSRGHAPDGLMAASLRPNEVTFAGTGAFRLVPRDAEAVRVQCVAGTLNARGAIRGGGHSTSLEE